jgi:hypothetical protein
VRTPRPRRGRPERAGAFELLAEAAASMWSVYQSSMVGPSLGDPWLPDLCRRALSVAPDARPATRARLLAMVQLMAGFMNEPLSIEQSDEAIALASAGDDPVAKVLAAAARLFSGQSAGPRWADWVAFNEVIDGAFGAIDDLHLRGMAGIYQSWGASGYGDGARFAQARDRVAEAAAVLRGPRLPAWRHWLDAQIALREGRWDDAIASTTTAGAITNDRAIGEMLVTAHTAMVLIHTGRAREAAADGRVQADPTFRGPVVGAFVALMTVLGGDAHAARELLSALQPDLAGARVPLAPAIGLAAWAAAAADDREAAHWLEPVLRPFRGVVMSGGVNEVASADRLLAGLVAVDGRHDEADELYASALALDERFGATAWTAHTRHGWARCLLARNGPGDRDRAADLRASSLETAEALGMRQVAAESRALAI